MLAIITVCVFASAIITFIATVIGFDKQRRNHARTVSQNMELRTRLSELEERCVQACLRNVELSSDLRDKRVECVGRRSAYHRAVAQANFYHSIIHRIGGQDAGEKAAADWSTLNAAAEQATPTTNSNCNVD